MMNLYHLFMNIKMDFSKPKINKSLILSISFLCIWIFLSSQLNQAQFGDNIEQFNWAHHAEWGYWKHPPLTTWLLIGLQYFIGFHEINTYLLSFLCLSITLYFYHRLARVLLSLELANVATLLLSASFMFSWRAQMFNHNTSLTMMTAILVWQFFSITKKSNIELKDWLLLSLTSALTLLAKYQSILIFLGLFFTLFLQKKISKPKIFYGLCISFIGTFILLLPHFYWIHENALLIREYTMDRFNISNFSFLNNIKNLMSFLIQQVRFFIGPLVLFFLYRYSLRKNSSNGISLLNIWRQHKTWLCGLFFLPLCLMIGLNLGGGVKLQNHWGMAGFLFFPLVLASLFSSNKKINQAYLFALFSVLQILSMIVFFYMKTHYEASSSKRLDTAYPGSIIAQTILADWKNTTACPLKIVAGPAFEAGIVSVYSGSYPVVLEEGDFYKTPWLDQEQLEASGSVKISNSINKPSQSNVHTFSPDVIQQFPFLDKMHWEIVTPKNTCSDH